MRLQFAIVLRILQYFNENFACCVANRRDRGCTDSTRVAKAKRAQPKMCGGFTCSKNALTALNILYIVVAFILIGVAVYGRASALVTNLPIIGGILACGVILFLISILGLIGAVKHHQVLLFFYMLILFLLFLIQFSIACACLAVNTKQQEQLAEEGWRRVGDDLRSKVENTFNCCGFNNTDEQILACNDPAKKVCCPASDINLMPNCPPCPTCMHKLQSTIDYAFKLCGSIGLFFSFTEVIAAFLARHYRNQLDPQEKAARAIFPHHNYLYSVSSTQILTYTFEKKN